jgi:hypothetical protein
MGWPPKRRLRQEMEELLLNAMVVMMLLLCKLLTSQFTRYLRTRGRLTQKKETMSEAFELSFES